MKTLFASPETWRKMEALAIDRQLAAGRNVQVGPDGVRFEVTDETALRLSRRAFTDESLTVTLERVIDKAYEEMINHGGMQ